MNQPVRRSYAFGECSLDVAERLLLRHGEPVPLPPKVFDTLVLLVENAGHLVGKDVFMEELWPGTFVGDDALTRNISILRKALSGTSDSQTMIVTVPTRGYRFEAPVREISEPEPALADSLRAKGAAPLQPVSAKEERAQRRTGLRGALAQRSWRSLTVFALAALAVGALAGLVTFALLSPAPLPRVIRLVQLTHSGRLDPWPGLVTDGTSIYFLEREGDHWNLMRTSVSGGESQIIPTPFKNAAVLDVSPDRANLLIGSFEERQSKMPLWIRPVSGGAFRRVGDVTAYGALWHPDGQRILYPEDDGMYICNADGTNARMFIATGGPIEGWSWSPDGKLLRFVTASESWETDADGKVLRRLPRSPDNIQNELAGAWSADGRYYFLDHKARRNWREIWAIREGRTLFHFRRPAPVRLTSGPTSFESMTPSRDGRKLFVVAMAGHGGDVVRFDPKSGQATSLLAGACAFQLVYSPDGQWVACESADESMMRMRPDGSEKLALSASSLGAYDIRWSPDAKQIAFAGFTKDGGGAVFVASADGGEPKQVIQESLNQSRPAWSPDGKFLAFQRAKDNSSPSSISILNLAKNQLAILPGLEGVDGLSWSPDGRFIAAVTEDHHKLMLYDFRTRHWAQLAEATVMNGDYMTWTTDSRCLYFQDILGKGEALNRVCMSDRKPQVAVSFEPLLRNGVQRAGFNGFAPDGAIIVSVDRGGSDIYALELDLP